MIQYWMKDQLIPALPAGLEITVDYEPDEKYKTYVTVFYEGGGQPGRYDLEYQELRFMVWVESEDWGLASYLANQIFKQFYKFEEQPVIEVEYYDKSDTLLFSEPVKLHKITAVGSPNPLGIEDGRRRYSVNFDATITVQKEETSNE